MIDETQMFTVPAVSTPEAVALALVGAIMRTEDKWINPQAPNKADRKWLLDTYAECLNAVRNPMNRVP